MNKVIIFSFLGCMVFLSYASEQTQLITSKKIGIFSDINKRKYLEEFFYHGKTKDGDNLYMVCDGHFCHRIHYTKNDDNDGSPVAQFLAQNFSTYFDQTSGSIRERMIAACKNIDNDIFIKEHKECGSTAAIVLVKDNVAHCAHVGNSRILLEKEGKIDFVTQDHVPNKEDETIRIIKAGGMIFEKRVNGFLSITRAFGDYVLDKKLIIAQPDYQEIPLTQDHKFLVLATNGLWDRVASEEVVGILNAKKSISDMNLLAKMLAGFAIVRNSRDNITVMLIDLLS